MDDNDRRAATCPSDETLAAWLDARLGVDHAEAIEAHVAGCVVCLELLAAIAPALALPDGQAGSGNPRPLPARAPASRYWRPVLGIAAMLAVAAGALTVYQAQRQPDTAAAFERLSRAQGSTRPTYGRLSGFAWAEPPATLRSGTAERPADQGAALASSAVEVVRAYDHDRSASARHAAGVAHLVGGQLAAAVAALDAAAAARPADVRILNDAAVAHLQRASTESDDASLERARRLAEEAVRIDPDAAAVWFNLAHIGRLAGDPALVDRARDACARTEPDSAWSRELQRW